MDDMPQMKLPTEFADPEEWKEHVRQTVSEEEVPFMLALGRTRMFVRFYETRKQPFPVRFRDELRDIAKLREPGKTQALEALNGRIFADMTLFLCAAAQLRNAKNSDSIVPAPVREIDELFDYLAKENPYFGLWEAYNKQTERRDDALSWEEFVTSELAMATDQEVEFALLMGQLAKVLDHFRKRDLTLPPHYFGRIWFLHYLRGPERNAQARAVVQGLTEAMASCTCA